MAKKHTKKALFTSVMSLVLCFAMLVGTTFAWFTDSVTSGNNIIKSGNLDVEMYWADGKDDPKSVTWTDASTVAIFNSDLWEPGRTEVRHIKIANEGTLALKYQLQLNANGDVTALTDAIDVYYMDPAVQVPNRTALSESNKLGTLTAVLAGMSDTASGTLAAGSEPEIVTLALKMRETAGNEYQNLSIGTTFSVVLLATQYEAEEDTFGTDYDVKAYIPEVAPITAKATVAKDAKTQIGNNSTNAEIPANAVADTVTEVALNVQETAVNPNVTVDTDDGAITFDVSFVDQDGNKVAFNAPVAVNQFIGKNLKVTGLYHYDDEITYDYDPNTGILSFTASDFSPFTVVYAFGGGLGTATAPYVVETVSHLEGAVTKGGNFMLTEDITLEQSRTMLIPSGKSVVLDLGGKKLSSADPATEYAINNSGTLTIKDSVGGGSVKARGIYNGYSEDNNHVTDAKLTILSGAYNAMGTNGGAAVYNYGIVDIRGGTFTSNGGYGLNNQSTGEITVSNATINGGIYNSKGNLIINNGTVYQHLSGKHAIYNYAGSVQINGGAFDSVSGNELILADGENASVVINGGTFDKTAKSWLFGAATNKNITFTINGGSFRGYVNLPENTVDTIRPYNDPIEVNGGTFNFDPTNWIAKKCVALNNNNGTWSVINLSASELNVYGLKLTPVSGDSNHYGTIYVDSKEDLQNLTKLNADWDSLFSDGNGTEFPNYPVPNYYYDWTWDIVLTNNIDFGGAKVEPIELGKRLYFNGNGHTIKNAVIVTDSTTENEAGLFNADECGVKNLKLDNIRVTGSNVGNSTAGILSGSCNAGIDNITITNSAVTGGKYTGGVIGYGYTDVENCTLTNVTVKGGYKLGGLIGYICASDSNGKNVQDNTLTYCTVDGIGDGVYAGGKTEYVIGKVVGNYNCNGTCNNNTITDMTTSATGNIGKIEAGMNVVTE